MKQYVLVIDVGTTNVRSIIYEQDDSVIAHASKPMKTYSPKAGWVEQDPNEIWEQTVKVIKATLKKAKLKAKDIKAIGITNQRSTNVLWNRTTGKSIGMAITWQDVRATEICDEINKRTQIKALKTVGGLFTKILTPDSLESKVKGLPELASPLQDLIKPIRQSKFGKLLVSIAKLSFLPTFSSVQTLWRMANDSEARNAINNGDALFGTLDSWLVWNLTADRIHATDVSNASSTAMYDPFNMTWSKTMLDMLGIPMRILPEVRESSGFFGETDPALFGSAIPIGAVIADQQAALFGEGCFSPGEVKITNGTGAFIDINTGDQPFASTNGLIPLVAWKVNGKVTYMLEGYLNMAGAAVDWLQSNLGLIDDVKSTSDIASSVPDTAGVYLVPAFSGLSSPYWDPKARGIVIGISRATNKKHIVRATLEAIGYRTRDVIRLMEQETELTIRSIRADGGASNNDFLLSFIADLINVDVVRPKNLEVTALGAAHMAGLFAGFYSSIDDLRDRAETDRIFKPSMGRATADRLYVDWKRAVERSLMWSK